MVSSRRLGAPDATNRAVLHDAVESLMLEEGYAAVTSRRVAHKAGLKPQLVHYYFRTMDDLFVETFRRRAEDGLRHQEDLLASPQPLRALWEFNTETVSTALTMEFMALANHRKAIRAEIAHYAERVRATQVEVISRVLDRHGGMDDYPANVVAVLLASTSRMLVMEQVLLGMSAGHTDTMAFVERQLRRFEGEPAAGNGPHPSRETE